jgi:hypothetical protein
MSKSRYDDSPVIDKKFFGTMPIARPNGGIKVKDLLEGVQTFEHTLSQGERLDHLAARFWGQDELWWLLAWVNSIGYPFPSGGLSPGTRLKIPNDPSEVLRKILR